MMQRQPLHYMCVLDHMSVLALAAVLALGLGGRSEAEAQSSAGQTTRALFKRGNAAYYGGRFDEASEVYEALLQTGIRDPEVHFNLGTAYAQQALYGRAIQHFLAAARTGLPTERTELGLRLCYERLAERRKGEQSLAVAPSLSLAERVVLAIPRDELGWGLIAFNLLLWGALALAWIANTSRRRRSALLVAGLAGCLTLSAAVALSVRVGWWRSGPEAVALRDGALVREGPDPRAPEAFGLLEGERVGVLDRQNEYVRVRLQSRREGKGRVAAKPASQAPAHAGWVLEQDLGIVD